MVFFFFFSRQSEGIFFVWSSPVSCSFVKRAVMINRKNNRSVTVTSASDKHRASKISRRTARQEIFQLVDPPLRLTSPAYSLCHYKDHLTAREGKQIWSLHLTNYRKAGLTREGTVLSLGLHNIPVWLPCCFWEISSSVSSSYCLYTTPVTRWQHLMRSPLK